jgi:hypothetical protein
MPLYEVVLRKDGREEVRLTDRRYEVGQTIEIGNQTWRVTGVRRGVGRAAARFVAEAQGTNDGAS